MGVIFNSLLASAALAEGSILPADPHELAQRLLGQLPGTVEVATWRDGQSSFAVMANDAHGQPIAPDAAVPPLMEIGSISKVFTGLLLAQAVERGELSLDTTLGQTYAGQLHLSPAVSAITLKELVTHHACLPRLPPNLTPAEVASDNPYARYDRTRLLQALESLTLPQSPPCDEAYSNWGAALLGDVLSLRYGQTWEQLVHDRITAPLGMNSTGVAPRDVASRLAAAYSGERPAAPWRFDAFASAGALRSTAPDLLLFGRAILAGRSGALGPAAERLVTPLADRRDGQIGYALNVHRHGDDRVFEHEGETGGYVAWLMVAPQTHEVLAILASNAEVPVASFALQTLAVRWAASAQPATSASAALAGGVADYVGVFRINPQAAFTFAELDGKLFGRVTGQGYLELKPEGVDTFVIPVASASYHFGRKGGQVSDVTLHQADVALVGQRTSETPLGDVRAKPGVLEGYAGLYRVTQEGQAPMEFAVRVRASQLTVKVDNQVPLPVFAVPGHPDQFTYDVVKANVDFERDGANRVVALVVHQGGDVRAVKVATP